MEQQAANPDEGKIFAFLAYLLGIIGFLIVLLAKKDNEFAMYHAKQSLVLSIAAMAIGVVNSALFFTPIPILGGLIHLALSLAGLGCFILWIVGIVNALGMQKKPLPIIGEYAEKLNI
jgi:uncharacterized membrane protein